MYCHKRLPCDEDDASDSCFHLLPFFRRRHSSCPPGSKKNEELVINTEIADEEGLENDDDNMTSEESKSSMTEEGRVNIFSLKVHINLIIDLIDDL